MANSESLSRKAASGVMWLYAEYGIQFLCQTIALIALARLLTPADFGVFAIGLMMVGVGETVFRVGLGPSIIQKPGNVDGYLEVAWTVNLVLAVLAFFVLAAITPWLNGVVFRSPESSPGTIAMLLSVPLSSCLNPQCLLLLKEMRYRQLFVIGLPRNIIRYGVAPLIAIWQPTYWAMVVAYVLSYVGEVILSYVIVPNRAQFLWKRAYFLEMYQFSGWLQINGILKWLSRYLDSFVVGNVLGTNALGLYNRAFTLASLPTQQVNMILLKVGFPLFAAIQTEKSRTNFLALHLLNLATLTFFPVVLGVLLFGSEIVRLVLGPEWESLVPALQILICAMYLRALADVLLIVMRSNGYSRLEFTNNLVRIVGTGASLYPLSHLYGMTGAALAVLVGSILAIPSVLFWSARVLELAWRRVVESITVVVAVTVLAVWLLWPARIWVHQDILRFVLAGSGALLLGFLVLAGFHAIFRIGPFESLTTAFDLLRRRQKRAAPGGDIR